MKKAVGQLTKYVSQNLSPNSQAVHLKLSDKFINLVKAIDDNNFADGPEAEGKFKKINTGNHIEEKATHMKLLGTGEVQVSETRDAQETTLSRAGLTEAQAPAGR